MSIDVNVVGKVILPRLAEEEYEESASLSRSPQQEDYRVNLLSEPLGGYINSWDTRQILSKGLRKASWLKAYYLNKELNREKYILDFIDLIVASVDEQFNSSVLDEAVYLFKVNLPRFLEMFQDNYFTSNKIALFFFALLDHKLLQVGGKLTEKDIEIIYSLPKITSRAFTFFKIKKVQNELYTRGIIKRKKKGDFYDPLRARVKDIISFLSTRFPELVEDLERVEKTIFDLINKRRVPGTNYKDASIIMIMSVINNLFSLKVRKSIWEVLSSEYNFDVNKMVKSVYRFRSRLKETELNQIIIKSYANNKTEKKKKKVVNAFELKKAVYLFSDKIMDQFPRLDKDLLLVEKEAYKLIDLNIHEGLDVDKFSLPVLLYQILVPKLTICDFEKERIKKYLLSFNKSNSQILKELKERIAKMNKKGNKRDLNKKLLLGVGVTE